MKYDTEYYLTLLSLIPTHHTTSIFTSRKNKDLYFRNLLLITKQRIIYNL